MLVKVGLGLQEAGRSNAAQSQEQSAPSRWRCLTRKTGQISVFVGLAADDVEEKCAHSIMQENAVQL